MRIGIRINKVNGKFSLLECVSSQGLENNFFYQVIFFKCIEIRGIFLAGNFLIQAHQRVHLRSKNNLSGCIRISSVFNGEFLLLPYTKSQIIIYNNFFYQGASRATDIFLTDRKLFLSECIRDHRYFFLIGHWKSENNFFNRNFFKNAHWDQN